MKACMLVDPIEKKALWPGLGHLFMWKQPSAQVQRSKLAEIPVGDKNFKAPDLAGSDAAKAGTWDCSLDT